MDQAQGRFHPLVFKLGEKVIELLGSEHALVNEGAVAQRWEVDTQFVFDPLANHIGPAFQVHVVEVRIDTGDEQVPERRHGTDGSWAQGRRVDGDITPSNRAHTLLGDDVVDRVYRDVSLACVLREESHTSGVASKFREVHALLGQDATEELVGGLDQNARPVA